MKSSKSDTKIPAATNFLRHPRYDISATANLRLEPVIENVTKFPAFCKLLTQNSLWGGYFFKLADNDPVVCSQVVGADSRK